jgi:hypothetical protein
MFLTYINWLVVIRSIYFHTFVLLIVLDQEEKEKEPIIQNGRAAINSCLRKVMMKNHIFIDIM